MRFGPGGNVGCTGNGIGKIIVIAFAFWMTDGILATTSGLPFQIGDLIYGAIGFRQYNAAAV